MFKYLFLLAFTSFAMIKDGEAHVDSAKLQEECNIANICRHDQVPVCGIDSCGEMRTYIDTCDMHEFNCDSKKVICSYRLAIFYDTHVIKFYELCDFVQKPAHECWVTCKRGRSFKKPLYSTDCDINNLV